MLSGGKPAFSSSDCQFYSKLGSFFFLFFCIQYIEWRDSRALWGVLQQGSQRRRSPPPPPVQKDACMEILCRRKEVGNLEKNEDDDDACAAAFDGLRLMIKARRCKSLCLFLLLASSARNCCTAVVAAYVVDCWIDGRWRGVVVCW